MARALLAVAGAAAAAAAPITSLPGLAQLPPFKMYSGYVDYTSPLLKSTHHTFHWVVESEGPPQGIAIWTNGGPGCSGLFGMGFEHGPFVAQADGGLALNPYSWNKHLTVVYIEQPAGVGFSWSSEPADYERYDDDVAASDNAAFLSAFFAMYPQYQGLPLFLTSESYGGNTFRRQRARCFAGQRRAPGGAAQARRHCRGEPRLFH